MLYLMYSLKEDIREGMARKRNCPVTIWLDGKEMILLKVI
jgi:hypothetical protein